MNGSRAIKAESRSVGTVDPPPMPRSPVRARRIKPRRTVRVCGAVALGAGVWAVLLLLIWLGWNWGEPCELQRPSRGWR